MKQFVSLVCALFIALSATGLAKAGMVDMREVPDSASIDADHGSALSPISIEGHGPKQDCCQEDAEHHSMDSCSMQAAILMDDTSSTLFRDIPVITVLPSASVSGLPPSALDPPPRRAV